MFCKEQTIFILFIVVRTQLLCFVIMLRTGFAIVITATQCKNLLSPARHPLHPQLCKGRCVSSFMFACNFIFWAQVTMDLFLHSFNGCSAFPLTACFHLCRMRLLLLLLLSYLSLLLLLLPLYLSSLWLLLLLQGLHHANPLCVLSPPPTSLVHRGCV